MSISNTVILSGYCANSPKISQSTSGKSKAVVVIYTRDYVGNGKYISQAHRCLFYGKKAEYIANKIYQGLHIHLRGMLRTYRFGDGNKASYYTHIIVDEFAISPPRSIEAIKKYLHEIYGDPEKINIPN